MLVVATLCAVPTAAFAAETSDTENTVVSEQQTEAKTTFKFGKFFRDIRFDGENKPTLPEGLEKPDMSKLKEKGFTNFKSFDNGIENGDKRSAHRIKTASGGGRANRERKRDFPD